MRGSVLLVALAGSALAASAAPPPKPRAPGKTTATPRPSPTPSTRPSFGVEVEQAGKVVPIEDHRVVLRREPFDLLLTLPDGGSVAVRASSNGRLYDQARSGAPLGRVFVPSQSGAEGARNPDKDLWVDAPNVQHAWSYDSKASSHRFNEVVPKGADLYRCRRTVAVLGLGDKVHPVEKFAQPSLYVVFLSGAASNDGMTTRETQTAFLMITFEDALADTMPPDPPARESPGEALLDFLFARDVATVKAHLPESLKKEARRLSPAKQQAFFEALRLAESLAASGGGLTERGKGSQPRLTLVLPQGAPFEISFDQERIQDDVATLEGRAQQKGQAPEPVNVRLVREAGRWRVAGVQGTSEPDPSSRAAVFARLDDPQLFDRLQAEERKSNEAIAIADLRAFISGLSVVSAVNQGFYLPPDCLEALSKCVAGYDGPEVLEPPFPWALPHAGYKWIFHAGPRPKAPEIKSRKAAASSLESYAFVGVPEEAGKTGTRGFCGDHTGTICFTSDGSPPAVKNGACATPCNELK